jgi:hypothetical protein
VIVRRFLPLPPIPVPLPDRAVVTAEVGDADGTIVEAADGGHRGPKAFRKAFRENNVLRTPPTPTVPRGDDEEDVRDRTGGGDPDAEPSRRRKLPRNRPVRVVLYTNPRCYHTNQDHRYRYHQYRPNPKHHPRHVIVRAAGLRHGTGCPWPVMPCPPTHHGRRIPRSLRLWWNLHNTLPRCCFRHLHERSIALPPRVYRSFCRGTRIRHPQL